MQPEDPKPRRAAIACIACRHSKIKCSGDDPCANCRRRSVACQYSDSHQKVLISESYLRDLQKQASNWQRVSGIKRPRVGSLRLDEEENLGRSSTAVEVLATEPADSPASNESDPTLNIWTSPFTSPSTIFKEAFKEQRKWIWLAPSSAWSLTARLTVMLIAKLETCSDIHTPRFYLDGDIYPFTWHHCTSLDPPDTNGLPALDYALYLFRTARFHFGQTYRFFDENEFTSQIQRFYSCSSSEKAAYSKFWYVEFLLVLALGDAYISQHRKQAEPPGSKYFVRAMAAMPNHTSTGKDSILAIEAMALAGLYLYALDHREAAHVQIGHAIRIAHMEGMHTQLPEEDLGAETVTRCRNLWWTLYIIDRQFSSSLGLPMITNDSDITILVNPGGSDSRELAFSLQVRLSQMLSYIFNTIYKTEKTRLGSFLEVTRNILEAMAGYSEEIEQMMQVNFRESTDSIPSEIRRTILLYHQCVIIATRPLLLSVLKERLEKLGRAEEDWQKFLALPKSLIAIGIKSAVKTLQILRDENSLLETFLPFDLELAYAAALHLTMANTLFPTSTEDENYSQTAHSVLGEMISCGNKVAEARKGELRRIENLFQQLAARVEQEGLRVLTLSERVNPGTEPVHVLDQQYPKIPETGAMTDPRVCSPMTARNHPLFLAEPPTPTHADSLSMIGVSATEILSIVDQIDHPEFHYGFFDGSTEWMSEHSTVDPLS